MTSAMLEPKPDIVVLPWYIHLRWLWVGHIFNDDSRLTISHLLHLFTYLVMSTCELMHVGTKTWHVGRTLICTAQVAASGTHISGWLQTHNCTSFAPVCLSNDVYKWPQPCWNPNLTCWSYPDMYSLGGCEWDTYFMMTPDSQLHIFCTCFPI